MLFCALRGHTFCACCVKTLDPGSFDGDKSVFCVEWFVTTSHGVKNTEVPNCGGEHHNACRSELRLFVSLEPNLENTLLCA